jgi:hypothetical protein
MKKLRLVDNNFKRKRLESKSDNVEEDIGGIYLNEVQTVTFDKFGKGRVARLDCESYSDGVDGWVGVVDQNIGYHLPTGINQVTMKVGGDGCAMSWITSLFLWVVFLGEGVGTLKVSSLWVPRLMWVVFMR